MRSGRQSGSVLVYLVTEDWYFLSHRLPMALSAQQAGYQIHVATRVDKCGHKIRQHGFVLHPLDWKRGSLNPINIVSIIRQVRDVYKRVKPDIVHHVALQPAVIGSLAASRLPPLRLNALAGLGFVYTSRSVVALAIKQVISQLLRILLNNPFSDVLVQNPDDRAAMAALGVSPDHTHLIAGSGVDTEAVKPLAEPAGEVTVAFVGRLLEDKGIRPLVAAHRKMIERGERVRLLIAGDRDPANPTSIPIDEIKSWQAVPGVEVLGHVAGIKTVWERAHIAVLPSRREGLPKSLLEAAAYGRPIVATDVPGCREVARHDLNAFLVPVDDPEALSGAITLLARDPALRARFGRAGRRLVEEEFSSDRIGQEIVNLYDRLLDRKTALLPAS